MGSPNPEQAPPVPRRLVESHPRRWRDFRYCYPVISRRSKGLSIGINLNPDGACNFDCIYCCVDRTRQPDLRDVDLGILRAELEHLARAAADGSLFDQPPFRGIPDALRRTNDLAFSGDGEPTASPHFPAAARIAAEVRRTLGPDEVKIVTMTDACYLTRPEVAEALAFLDRHNGEIWAKLDAGTQEYFQLVNRPRQSLDHVIDNILSAARVRPIVIQSLFMRVADSPPPPGEIRAYAERIRWLLEHGGRLSRVQVYTVARRTARPDVSPLSLEELEAIAGALRPLGVAAECFA